MSSKRKGGGGVEERGREHGEGGGHRVDGERHRVCRRWKRLRGGGGQRGA